MWESQYGKGEQEGAETYKQCTPSEDSRSVFLPDSLRTALDPSEPADTAAVAETVAAGAEVAEAAAELAVDLEALTSLASLAVVDAALPAPAGGRRRLAENVDGRERRLERARDHDLATIVER
jgi:hypothetical protein